MGCDRLGLRAAALGRACALGALIAWLPPLLPKDAHAQFAGGGGSAAIDLAVADWMFPRIDPADVEWSIVPAGAALGAAIATADGTTLTLTVPPGTYDVYWSSEAATDNNPLLLSAGLLVDAGEVETIAVDSGVTLAVADGIPARDPEYGWWGAAARGTGWEDRVTWSHAAETLVLPPGSYDIYWAQDFETREHPLLLAAGVSIAAGELTTVEADSGVRLDVADWVPPPDRDYGWWGAVPAGAEPDAPVNWSLENDTILLPPGTYDIYLVEEFVTRENPVLIAPGVAVAAAEISTVSADTGVSIELADWVPDFDPDYGWWGAVPARGTPDEPTNWTRALDSLLLPAGSYDIYAATEFVTRNDPMLLAQVELAPGEHEIVRFDSGLSIAIAQWVPELDPDYGWWGAVPAGGDPDDPTNWSRRAEALLLPPGTYDVYWVQDFLTRDKPMLLEAGVVVGPAEAKVVNAGFGILLDVADWVPPLDPDYGWWGAAPAGGSEDDLVNWTRNVDDGLLLPPGSYDVFWAQDFATRDLATIIAVDIRIGGFTGIGAQLRIEGLFPLVVSVIPDQPAAAAGILAGDRLVAVNGKTLSGVPLDTAVDRIRGAAGTSVTIRVERPGEAAPRDIVVARAAITAAPSFVDVDSGIQPVLEGGTPLDPNAGWWGAVFAGEPPDPLYNWYEGRSDLPLVLPPYSYDVYWRPDRSTPPQLKAEDVLVGRGQLVEVAIGSANLNDGPAPQPPAGSVVTLFEIRSPEAAMNGGSFPAGVGTIEARYDWSGATVGHELGVRWYRGDREVLVQVEPVAEAAGTVGWVLETKDGSALPNGSYRVDLLENGEVRRSINFQISPANAQIANVPPDQIPSPAAAPTVPATAARLADRDCVARLLAGVGLTEGRILHLIDTYPEIRTALRAIPAIDFAEPPGNGIPAYLCSERSDALDAAVGPSGFGFESWASLFATAVVAHMLAATDPATATAVAQELGVPPAHIAVMRPHAQAFAAVWTAKVAAKPGKTVLNR